MLTAPLINGTKMMDLCGSNCTGIMHVLCIYDTHLNIFIVILLFLLKVFVTSVLLTTPELCQNVALFLFHYIY